MASLRAAPLADIDGKSASVDTEQDRPDLGQRRLPFG
jgi:hypothetical protein